MAKMPARTSHELLSNVVRIWVDLALSEDHITTQSA